MPELGGALYGASARASEISEVIEAMGMVAGSTYAANEGAGGGYPGEPTCRHVCQLAGWVLARAASDIADLANELEGVADAARAS